MANILYIDIETFSPVDLPHCGVYKYSEDVKLLLFAYALNDNPVKVWDATQNEMPADLLDYLLDDSLTFCAHNSNFERVVLSTLYPEFFKNRRWRDTMVRAYRHGLPGGLSMLSKIYKLSEDQAKDSEGRKLVMFFCKPTKDGKQNTAQTHPVEWQRFVRYNSLDVEAERVIDKKLPSWNDTSFENKIWALDQRINDRGFLVDTDLAVKMISFLNGEKDRRNKRTLEMTNGEIESATRRDALLKHILDSYGIELPDLQMSTIKRRIEDPDIPVEVRELLELRIQSASTSVKKYEVLQKAACKDGRLRGSLQYCGAHRTGRWGGRLFQPQNLPRIKMKPAIIESGIEAIKAGCGDLLIDEPVKFASAAIRGEIISGPGKKQAVSDLASIEGRVVAWLAGETWKLKAYSDLDMGQGYDMYIWAYAKTFNVPPETVTDEERTLGKPIELALGYGGGVGAFITFANVYHVDLTNVADQVWPALPRDVVQEAKEFWEWSVGDGKTFNLDEKVFIACDSIKRLWRKNNPAIVQFWHDLENAAYNAVLYNRVTRGRGWVIDKVGSWMRIRLPSGRFLCYPSAHVEDKKLKYVGINQYSRKWCKLSTYGGKLAENVTQAVSRDVHAYGALKAEESGYPIILLVHDELVTEPFDSDNFTHEKLSKIISTNPEWAPDLPLNAEGFEAKRYRKD